MTIEKAVDELIKAKEISTLEDFISKVRTKTGTVLNDSRLVLEINKNLLKTGDIAISLQNNNDLILRENLAKNAKVTIQITDEEQQMRKLFIGHRLMPFINPIFFNSLDLDFRDKNGKKLTLQKQKIDMKQALKYVRFLDWYLLLPDYGKDENVYLWVNLSYLDISPFSSKYRYFEVSFLDYSRRKFVIEPIDDSDYLKRHFTNKRKDQLLIESVINLVEYDTNFYSVDETLLSAYFHFAKENISDPGSPFAAIYNDNKQLQVYTSESITYFNTDNKQININKEIERNIVPGKAKDIDGIFRELGLSFSSNFVYLLFIYFIIEDKEIDEDYIFEDILDIADRIANVQQTRNFEKAYNKLQEKAIKDVAEFDKSETSIEYLRLIVDLEEEIIFFIRNLDEAFHLSYEEKMKIIMPLIELDRIVHDLINRFAAEKFADQDDLTVLTDLYDSILDTIETLQYENDI
ncbi:MAG: hypothetical protein K9N40_04350 [Candidatus Cloacimonetes bacterium]|nr:hypothetical protein [Candidatus Cloacimonadota bacterium]